MAKRNRQLRYIEISRRNQASRIFVGSGNICSATSIGCGEVCIDIVRKGSYNCKKVEYDTCGNAIVSPLCPRDVATVCALEIDDDGFAVFEWPAELLSLNEGWYEGHVRVGCDTCAVLPLRIGARCNVIEVETIISGPDSLCDAGCDPVCADEICPPQSTPSGTIYIPDYS